MPKRLQQHQRRIVRDSNKRRFSHMVWKTVAKNVLTPKAMALCIIVLGSLSITSKYSSTVTSATTAVVGTKNNNSIRHKKQPQQPGNHTAISCDRYNFPPSSTTTTTTLLQQNDDNETLSSQWHTAVRFVLARQLTFLHYETLEFHAQLLQQIERDAVKGMILECGVAKAGSSITFAAVKNKQRCLHLFDTFEGIPAPSEKDGTDVHTRYKVIASGNAGENYYGYMKNLLEYDQQQFADAGYWDAKHNSHHVYFHKGLFQDTVWPVGPVAYAHLDGDWYESTFGMLERIEPFLEVGGYFVLDDVGHYSGATRAFEDFFQVSVDRLRISYTYKPCLARQKEGTAFEVMFSVKATARKVVIPSASESDQNPPCPAAV